MAEEKAPRRRRRWIALALVAGLAGWYVRSRAARPAPPLPAPRVTPPAGPRVPIVDDAAAATAPIRMRDGRPAPSPSGPVGDATPVDTGVPPAVTVGDAAAAADARERVGEIPIDGLAAEPPHHAVVDAAGTNAPRSAAEVAPVGAGVEDARPADVPEARTRASAAATAGTVQESEAEVVSQEVATPDVGAMEVPAFAEVPGAAATPEAAEVSGAAATPRAGSSEVGAVEVPGVAEEPKAAAMPGAGSSDVGPVEGPGAAEVPEFGATPEARTPDVGVEVPAAARLPEAATTPEAGTPDVGAVEVSGAADVPRAVATQEAGKVPGPAQAPEAAVTPEASEVPDADQVSEAGATPEAGEVPEAGQVPEAGEGSDAAEVAAVRAGPADAEAPDRDRAARVSWARPPAKAEGGDAGAAGTPRAAGPRGEAAAASPRPRPRPRPRPTRDEGPPPEPEGGFGPTGSDAEEPNDLFTPGALPAPAGTGRDTA